MTGMNEGNPAPTTIYCTRCGLAMSVAPQHERLTVGCPHCGEPLEPWRVIAASPAPAAGVPPTAPPRRPVEAPAAPCGGYGGYGQPAGVSSRHKVIAGLLGFFVGGLGAHRFYMGFIGIGILQIVVTIITFGFGSLWGFVEGILCLAGQMRDVDGLELRD